jgi:CBS domain-containing protein
MELPPPLCVAPTATLGEVLQSLQVARRGSALICREERIAGIFTERDALFQMAQGADLDVPIEQLMSAPVVTVSPEETVESAIARMSLGGYRQLPVVDDQERPVGVLKVSSILRHLVQHFPRFVYNLPPTPDFATRQREGA